MLGSVICLGAVLVAGQNLESLLLLPVEAGDPEDSSTARLLDDALLLGAQAFRHINVRSHRELQDQLSQQRAKDLVGCEDVVCLTEIVGALDARYVLTAFLGKLAGVRRLTLRLRDVRDMSVRVAMVDVSTGIHEPGQIDRRVEAALGQLLSHLSAPEEKMDGNTGELLVNSNPPGATVYIGAKERGTTPLLIPRLPSGRHRIVLRREGFATLTRDVVVKGGERTTTADNVLSVQRGGISLRTDPPGATCLIDGKHAGVSPCQMSDLLVGEHEIELRLVGYDVTRHVVRVSEEQTTIGEYSLVASAVDVTFLSTPRGAQVFVDDDVLGETDRSVELRPGSYRVLFSKAGYIDHSVTLTLGVGEPRMMEVTLKPGLSEYQLAEMGRRKVWAWSTTGVAAVAFSVAAWSGLRVLGFDHDLENQPAGTKKTNDRIAAAKTAAGVADVSFGIGIASAIAAGSMWLAWEF